jgi:exonuclease III
VIIVGDLNLADTSKDVHSSMNWAKMYHLEEITAFRALLAGQSDVWRLQNPYATDCYTVWDEKTAARSVNRVLSHTTS